MTVGSSMLASILASATAGLVIRVVVPPRHRLASRLRPYAALGRSRLGTGYADVSVVSLVAATDRSVLWRVLGPSIEQCLDWLARRFDIADYEELELRLRQAGMSHLDPVQYRMRQLASGVGGVSLGVFLGLTLLGSPGGVLLLMLAFGFPAATVQRNRVQRAIDLRRARMRTEVYTVTQLVAVHLRTGHGPVEAIRSVSRLGRGPVVEELREALNWMSGGALPQESYERLAATTPEPSAARLYRLLAASARSGGDIGGALLAVGDDLRAERRDEVARLAVKRRTAMLAPLLMLIAPVMVLFVGAALPSLVLGPVR